MAESVVETMKAMENVRVDSEKTMRNQTDNVDVSHRRFRDFSKKLIRSQRPATAEFVTKL